jgi:hypothetical protein
VWPAEVQARVARVHCVLLLWMRLLHAAQAAADVVAARQPAVPSTHGPLPWTVPVEPPNSRIDGYTDAADLAHM